MWLSSSSVGRKFIMAITGAVLVLFVTFHCLMNSIAICWPTAYNSICLFLGANWYALIASAALALFIVVHIIYAVMLTLQNRKARGNDRYLMSRRPKTVEWSSQNMFVLGIVVLAFLCVHMIQFWAKMQLMEVLGKESTIPASAGTLFIQEAFSQIWTPIVYIIGFIALWFHFNHGFWSMFQSVGWDSTVWICRLKKISAWWTSIVVILFIAQAIVFTVKANDGFYKEDPALRAQYKEMLAPMIEKDFGPEGAQVSQAVSMMPYDQISSIARQQLSQIEMQMQSMNSPEAKAYFQNNPEAKEQAEKQYEVFKRMVALFDYLEGNSQKTENQNPVMQPVQ